MSSVVDTSVKHFMHTMAAAPVLSGTAGAMIAVLDACLVNGFDIKVTTSLVVASGVATLSFAGTHSATVDSVVLVEGVTGALIALNGEQKVTAIGAGVVKFATTAADGTAAGTISFKMAPAGWEKVFSGTNLAVYRSLDQQSTKMFFRVDDTGTTSCRIRGFETMTDVSTGSGLFPTDAQRSGGGYMNKSSSASVTAVKWKLIGDSRSMYISVVGYSSGSPTGEGGRTVPIGDFAATMLRGDPYAFLIGCSTNGDAGDINGTCDLGNTVSLYAPRAYSGSNGSLAHASLPETGAATAKSGADSFFGAFPSEIDGSMYLSRRWVSSSAGSPPRGILRGIYTIPQSSVGLNIAPGSVVPGTGPLAGRGLLALGCGASGIAYPNSNLGITLVDITGPWR